jgi:hypothetical protein
MLAAVTLGACSASISLGQPTLSKATVEQNAAAQLHKQVPNQPTPTVTCPHDLNASVGATEKCTLTASDGTTLPMTVRVDKIDGGVAQFNVQVGH